jgi:hypothetical protein
MVMRKLVFVFGAAALLTVGSVVPIFAQDHVGCVGAEVRGEARQGGGEFGQGTAGAAQQAAKDTERGGFGEFVSDLATTCER